MESERIRDKLRIQEKKEEARDMRIDRIRAGALLCDKKNETIAAKEMMIIDKLKERVYSKRENSQR